MSTAGYSGTPLAQKLGLNEGAPLWASGMPASVKTKLDAQARPHYLARPAKALAAAHVFHTGAAKLAADLEMLRAKLAPDGTVWGRGQKRRPRSRPTSPKM
jgi:hypothetical protein